MRSPTPNLEFRVHRRTVAVISALSPAKRYGLRTVSFRRTKRPFALLDQNVQVLVVTPIGVRLRSLTKYSSKKRLTHGPRELVLVIAADRK